ncbi:MAG: hypothetical protein B6D73_15165 [gamma proteobacterium symbiont of Stewartia floridana]|nr:MAG: hypothetical protein B6D73_15165 [gamma proteobacterium symbiont of Stewartia floridana]
MLLDQLIRDELEVELIDYRAMEADSREIIKRYTEARQYWVDNKVRLVTSQAKQLNKQPVSEIFTDPKEKRELDELEVQYKNALIARDYASKKCHEIIEFGTKEVSKLGEYDQNIKEMEENSKLKSDYIESIKNCLSSIDHLVANCPRFISDMSDIENQAEREKALLEVRQERAEAKCSALR